MKKLSVLCSLLLFTTNLYASDYTQAHTFVDREVLTHTLLNTEFAAIETAIATKSDEGSATFTSTITIDGVATDITTDTNEHLTLTPNGTGNIVAVTDELNFNDGAATISTTSNNNLTISTGTGTITLSGNIIDFNNNTLSNLVGIMTIDNYQDDSLTNNDLTSSNIRIECGVETTNAGAPVGEADITFGTAFTTAYVVVAVNAANNTSKMVTAGNLSTTGFHLRTTDNAGGDTSDPVYWIAIGSD